MLRKHKRRHGSRDCCRGKAGYLQGKVDKMLLNMFLQTRSLLIVIVTKVKNDHLLMRLLQGVSISFVLIVSGTIVGFLQRLLLARIMTLEMYGTYTYVFSWLTVLTVIGVAGWNFTSLRFTASYYGQSLFGVLKTFWHHSYRRVALTTIGISLLSALLVWLLRERLEHHLVLTFSVMCLALLLTPFLELTGRNLMAIGLVTLGVGPKTLFNKLLLLIGVVVVWGITGQQLTAVSVLFMHLIIVAVIFGVSIFVLGRRLADMQQLIVNSHVDKEQRTEWNKTAFGMNVLAILMIANQQIDIILVGMLLGAVQAGIYGTVALISGLMSFGLSSLNYIIAPMIADLYQRERLDELQKLLGIAAILITLYISLVCIAVIVGGKQTLRIFGPEFVSGYSALLVLIVGQSVKSLFGSVSSLLDMTGNQKISILALSISAVMGITANFALIPIWGMLGAAWAKTLTFIAWNIIMYIYVKWKMGLDPTLISVIGLVVKKQRLRS